MIDKWFGACDIPIISSDWIITEFASALSIKERSGTLSAKNAKAARRNFGAFCQAGLRLAPWPYGQQANGSRDRQRDNATPEAARRFAAASLKTGLSLLDTTVGHPLSAVISSLHVPIGTLRA